MTGHAPESTVAIGMPVYNGERWLARSVGALLAQTRGDFTLIISDNASTDATERIARELAAADPRVHYHRNPGNIGVFRNYDRAFHLSRSRYFKWASCSDLCAPGFLAECIAELERRPEAVLAYPSTALFTAEPGDGPDYPSDPDLREPDPVARFRRVLVELRLNNAFNGVYRADALRRTQLNGEYMGSDIVVVAEMALAGTIVRLPQRLFFRRMTPESATAVIDDERRRAFFAGAARDVAGTPTVDMHRHLFRAVARSGLPAGARLRAYGYLGRRLWWAKRDIGAELAVALRGGAG